MAFIYYKTPDEIERIGVNFEYRLGDSDQVASGAEVITDSDGVDVTEAMMIVGSEAISDENSDGVNDTITVKVRAGTMDRDYKLVISATTDNSEVKEEIILIKVREEQIG